MSAETLECFDPSNKGTMHSVPLSDQAFTHAKRAAAANGLTLPDYLESLIIHDAENLDEGGGLTPDQIAKIREGQTDVKAGRVYTPDQVRENLQCRHDAWLQAHPD